MGSPGHKALVKAPGAPVAFTLESATQIRQNLHSYSDPTVVDGTTFTQVSNVTAVLPASPIPHPSGGSFNGGAVFGDNSVQRFVQKDFVSPSVGARYIYSFYVLMGDASAPSVGATNSTGDFSVLVRGNLAPAASTTVTSVGSNVYRVSVAFNPASGDPNDRAGVIKYTGQSSKTFKVTGFQIEKAPSISTTVGTYTPTQATPEYGKLRVQASKRVWDATATVTVLEEGNGAKYANAGSGAASGQVNDIAFHPSGNWVATVGTNGIFAHAWTNSGGFGSPCSSIPSLPGGGTGLSCAWSPDGAYFLVGHTGTLKFSVYPFNATTGTFSAAISYAGTSPDTVSSTGTYGVAWHPSGTYFALGLTVNPGVYVYSLIAGVITIVGNPAGGTPGGVNCLSWNYAGDRIIAGHAGTATNQTYMSMWAFTTTFGALQTQPASPPSAQVLSLSVHPSDGYVAYTEGSNLKGYVLSAGAWGAALTTLALSGTGNDVRFSPSGNHVAVANGTSNYLSVSPFAGQFAALLAQPSTAPPGAGTAIGWSIDGKVLGIGSSASPYVHMYQFSKASSETWIPNRLDGWVQAAAANYGRQGILVSSSYLPMSTLGSTRDYSAKMERMVLDTTAFGSNDEVYSAGLRRLSGSLGRLKEVDTTLLDGITTDTSLVLEVYKHSSDTEPTRRYRVLIGDVTEEAPLKDIITEKTIFIGFADADKRTFAIPALAI